MMQIVRAATAALDSRDSDEEDAPPLAAAQREQLATLLEECRPIIATHLMPCMGLGTGHGNLDGKLHAWLYACHLECGNWSTVQRFCNSVISITTDWGVEAGLAGVPRIAFDEYFPYWSDAPYFNEEMQEEGAYFDEEVLEADMNLVEGQPAGVPGFAITEQTFTFQTTFVF